MTTAELNRKDFIQFCDGSSYVPFFISDGVYKPTSSVTFKNSELDFENKVYFKDNSKNYYVTIRISKECRIISSSEYNYIVKEIEKQKEKFKKEQKKQLEFKF